MLRHHRSNDFQDWLWLGITTSLLFNTGSGDGISYQCFPHQSKSQASPCSNFQERLRL